MMLRTVFLSLWSASAVLALSQSERVDRRSLVQGAGGAIATASQLMTLRPKPAFAADQVQPQSGSSLAVPRNQAVVVLGASGKTGRECISALLQDGRPCIATSRGGDLVYYGGVQPGLTNPLTIAPADVKSLDSLSQIIVKGVGAVIFAASTSKQGGDSFEVDRDGVINAARACIAADVPRLVVVSSGGVSRPDSAIYKLLNFAVKGVMEAKIQGEDTVRELYASPDVLEKKLGYTIIRPGGLLTEAPVGAGALELNQGDDKSGRLPRTDVASLCVQCLSSENAFDTTFECYEADTAKPVESIGLSNLLKSRDPTEYTSGKERRGKSWADLFNGLERDPGHNLVAYASSSDDASP